MSMVSDVLALEVSQAGLLSPLHTGQAQAGWGAGPESRSDSLSSTGALLAECGEGFL